MDPEENEGLSENELFKYNPEDLDEEEDDDGLDGFLSDDANADTDLNDQAAAGDEEEEEDDENLNFEEEEEADDITDPSDLTDEDVIELNKKFGSNKSKEELKSFLSQGEAAQGNTTDDQEFTEAQNTIDFITPVLRLGDEDLLRKDFETRASQAGKDLNDDDVRIEIEDKIQDIIDSNQLDIRADKLRDLLTDKVLNPALGVKNKIEAKRIADQQANEKSRKEKIQNTIADYYSSGDFFGIKPDKTRSTKAYQDVSSGSLITKLQENETLAAEVAMMLEYKDELYKKATGKTYSDGVKSVLDDYKSKKDRAGSPISNAQKRGSSGGSDASKDLISGLLYTKPKEDKK